MIEDDIQIFNQKFQLKKNEVEMQQNMADEEMKKKKQLEVEFRVKQHQLQSLRNEKLRNDDLIQIYNEHKNFLDKLSPKDLMENKEKEK